MRHICRHIFHTSTGYSRPEFLVQRMLAMLPPVTNNMHDTSHNTTEETTLTHRVCLTHKKGHTLENSQQQNHWTCVKMNIQPSFLPLTDQCKR